MISGGIQSATRWPEHGTANPSQALLRRFRRVRPPNAAELTYYGLYALQHRGQESAGIVSCDGKLFRQHKGMSATGF